MVDDEDEDGVVVVLSTEWDLGSYLPSNGVPGSKVCNFPHTPSRTQGKNHAMERHNLIQRQMLSIESPYFVASLWKLSSFSIVSCVSTATRVTCFEHGEELP